MPANKQRTSEVQLEHAEQLSDHVSILTDVDSVLEIVKNQIKEGREKKALDLLDLVQKVAREASNKILMHAWQHYLLLQDRSKRMLHGLNTAPLTAC